MKAINLSEIGALVMLKQDRILLEVGIFCGTKMRHHAYILSYIAITHQCIYIVTAKSWNLCTGWVLVRFPSVGGLQP